jgi:predicted secreted Zn-dependent protease
MYYQPKLTMQSVKWSLIPTLAVFLLAANFHNSLSALTQQEDATKPEASTQTIYYDISGTTLDELRSQMQELGPVDKTGEHYHANTEWHINWSHTCQKSDDAYGVGSVEVKIEVTFTFPRWVASSDVNEKLVKRWDVYMRALQKHEDGHKNIAVEAGTEIIRRLKGLASYASCEELDAAVSTAGHDVVEEYRQKEKRYDKETEHGTNQGAHLP